MPRPRGAGMDATDQLRRKEGTERPLARLPRWAAWAVLALLAACMALAAADALAPAAGPATATQTLDEGEGDLALYARISDRVMDGEGYYAAALAEHRAGNYPAFPFVTIRQPTLAMLHGLVGLDGARWLAMALLGATILAFLWRLRIDAAPAERIAAGVLVLLGGALAITPEAALIHEMWAGLLLSLSLALYRPHRWWPALVAAALALAVRELAAPFVLLWLAVALWQRRWGEAGAVAAVLVAFALGMALHAGAVAEHRLATDGVSQGWDAMAGPGLPLSALARLTALLVLPAWLAAPLALLPLLGWAGLGRRLGLFAFCWFGGFFLAMSLFARPENFYWVQLTLPAYLAGFAFVPRALADLLAAGRGRNLSHS